MEQSNQPNESLKPLKDLLSFLTPQTTFIVNAAFAVVAFVLFILQDITGFGPSLISWEFKIAGGIIGFLVLVGLLIAAITVPLKTNKISPCVNIFLIGFMFLFNLMAVTKWGILTILLLVLILLPWALFTVLKKDDEAKL